MSIHPSLNTPEKDKKHRSVMKRTERIKTMVEKGAWKEGDKVYGLPKIKALKIKVKKEKAEKAEEATAVTEGAVPAAAGTAQAKPAAKEASVKPAAKEKEKK